MAAASSQSARDRSGSLLGRATCPWRRTRARTREARFVYQPCVSWLETRTWYEVVRREREREWSFQAPFSIVGSPKRFFGVQWRNLFFFFFFFWCTWKVIRRREIEFSFEDFERNWWDLESLVHRFELIWSNSRSPFSTFFRWLIEV